MKVKKKKMSRFTRSLQIKSTYALIMSRKASKNSLAITSGLLSHLNNHLKATSHILFKPCKIPLSAISLDPEHNRSIIFMASTGSHFEMIY